MANEALLNLLMQLGPAGTPGAAAAGPPDPLLPAQGGAMDAVRQSELARQALVNAQPPETVEPDPMKKWQTVVQALLSGASTYAAGLNPGVQARDFVGEMEAQRQQAADRLNQQNQEEFGRERQNLLLTLQDAIRGEDRARQDFQRQEDMRFRSGERQMDQAVQREQTREARAERVEDRNFEATLRRQLATLRSGDGSPEDVRQRQARIQAKQGVLGIRDQIASGELGMSPEEIRQRFEESLDIQDLSPEGRADVIDFYLSKVEPMLQDMERASAEQAKKDAEETQRRQVGGRAEKTLFDQQRESLRNRHGLSIYR